MLLCCHLARVVARRITYDVLKKYTFFVHFPLAEYVKQDRL